MINRRFLFNYVLYEKNDKCNILEYISINFNGQWLTNSKSKYFNKKPSFLYPGSELQENKSFPDPTFKKNPDPDQALEKLPGFADPGLTEAPGSGSLTLLCRLKCDEDGWVLQVNDEIPYPHYIHPVPLTNITTIEVIGDIEVR